MIHWLLTYFLLGVCANACCFLTKKTTTSRATKIIPQIKRSLCHACARPFPFVSWVNAADGAGSWFVTGEAWILRRIGRLVPPGKGWVYIWPHGHACDYCSALVAATNLTIQPLGVNRRPVVMDLGHVLMVGSRYLFLNILFLNKFQILLQIQIFPAPAITLFQEPPLLRAFGTPLSPRGDHIPQSRLYASLHCLHVFCRPNRLCQLGRDDVLLLLLHQITATPRDLRRSSHLW